MSDTDRTELLERRVIMAEVGAAVRAAGGNEKVGGPIVAGLMRVTESGDVRSRDGRTAAQVIEALKADPDYASVLGGPSDGTNGKPSWEGKSWNKMTTDEKVAYTSAKYGKDGDAA